MLPATSFYKSKTKKNGILQHCKSCRTAAAKALYHGNAGHRLKANAASIKANRVNSAKRNAKAALKYREDPEMRKRIALNRKARYQRVKRDADFLIRSAIGNGLREAMRSKGQTCWFDVVGYDGPTLRRHLEKQFAPGMTWANFGHWHIDHITPTSAFDFIREPLQSAAAAWALPNLRPLWRVENLEKHARRTHLL
jgi:hypothetical protein